MQKLSDLDSKVTTLNQVIEDVQEEKNGYKAKMETMELKMKQMEIKKKQL